MNDIEKFIHLKHIIMNDVEKLKQISADMKKMEKELKNCQKSLNNIDKKFKKIITKV